MGQSTWAIWRSAAVALAKTNPAWREQTVLIALLGVVAVIANWISTGDHLIKTIFTDPYWAVAGVDLSLLAGSLIALLAVKKKKRSQNEGHGCRLVE